MASQDWLDKDFYATLGVTNDVSDEELRKVYRRLARKYHPDSNPGKESEARFKEISEAYTVLSDPEQRKEYDEVRAYGAGPRFTASGPGFESFYSSFLNNSGSWGDQGRFRVYNPSAGDGFPGFAGGAFDKGSFTATGPAPGGQDYERMGFGDLLGSRDTNATTTIDLRTAVDGGSVNMMLPSGESLRVKVPAGIEDGQKLRVAGKGQPSPYQGKAGDLVLTVKIRPHPVFERDGKDLRVKLPVSYTEAALGATVEVPTLRRRRVKIRIQPGTPSGRVLRVRGEGVKTGSGSGDLLAVVQIMPPADISGEVKELMEKLAPLTSGEDLRHNLMNQAEL